MDTNALIEKAILALISAAIGWLVSAARKISPEHLTDFEERVVAPIAQRVEKLEEKIEHTCTRDELREAIREVKVIVETQRRETRETLLQIFNRLDRRQG